MRELRLLQNANPFRIGLHIASDSQSVGRVHDRVAAVIDCGQKTVRVETAIAIQIDEKAEVQGRTGSAVGFDKYRHAWIVKLIGKVEQEIIWRQRSAVGGHVADVGGIANPASEAQRIDVTLGDRVVDDVEIRVRQNLPHNLGLGPLHSVVGGQFRIRLVG